jgi:cell division protease FtsH
MVKEYGMSEKLGQVYFAPKRQFQFLGPIQDSSGDYSGETANIIDEEVKRIIDEQYGISYKILQENKELLVSTASRLLTDETIEGESLTALADEVRTKQTNTKEDGSQSRDRALAA